MQPGIPTVNSDNTDWIRTISIAELTRSGRTLNNRGDPTSTFLPSGRRREVSQDVQDDGPEILPLFLRKRALGIAINVL